MEDRPRSELPDRPGRTGQPVFAAYEVARETLPPGSGRHHDRGHLLRMESGGAVFDWRGPGYRGPPRPRRPGFGFSLPRVDP